MAATASRPRVFLDVSIDNEPAGRLVIELFQDKAPKTCENFRTICTGSQPPLTYKLTPFHRIIDEFMIQGGDITKGNGTGGTSIYGSEFEDENIGWREIDKEGLVCMANRGKNTNSSQFFITLAPCPHLNAKHTVFGHIVSGKETLERMAKVHVDREDKPLVDVIVSHCGELERKKKQGSNLMVPEKETSSSTSRGRHKRRRSTSPDRSPSPSRGHGRESGSRHRRHHRQHDRDLTSASPPAVKNRRRGETSPDHNLRGRPKQRSRSRSKSPIPEKTDATPEKKHHRKRSPPPSRPRSKSPSYRRQRSLPNQYNNNWREEEGLRRSEQERDGDRYMQNPSGRLGGGDRRDDGGGGGEVKYKGRGAMKFREQKEKERW
ncbi:hypothetical protein EJ08DRAFT_583736 [Tothia fuscella]|uniref:peptidylprolyl isomerase n=1 Tax=Tothia fuscella TaxID=1048955 RepID=A0A9P4U195_9PEZI|nr:hypothetical protein EJ08DRAFT_583736 [Tothia fuscella]